MKPYAREINKTTKFSIQYTDCLHGSCLTKEFIATYCNSEPKRTKHDSHGTNDWQFTPPSNFRLNQAQQNQSQRDQS